MKTLSTVGRVMYSLPFVIFGMMHMMMGSKMAGMVPSFMPGAIFWVYLTGAALLAGGISIMMGKMVKLAGLGLALLLMIFVLTIHVPMMMSGNETMMQMGMLQMLKDIALIGAALLIAGIFDK